MKSLHSRCEGWVLMPRVTGRQVVYNRINDALVEYVGPGSFFTSITTVLEKIIEKWFSMSSLLAFSEQPVESSYFYS